MGLLASQLKNFCQSVLLLQEAKGSNSQNLDAGLLKKIVFSAAYKRSGQWVGTADLSVASLMPALRHHKLNASPSSPPPPASQDPEIHLYLASQDAQMWLTLPIS